MSQFSLLPPAGEPVSIAECRAWLRLDDPSEDALLAALITAARQHLELVLGRAFMRQTWRLVRDIWPEKGMMVLPIAPVRSLLAVTVQRAGTAEPVSTGLFQLDGQSSRPRLGFRAGSLSNPDVAMNGITLDLEVGYGEAGDVPAPLLQALRQLVAYWYENRALLAVNGEQAALPKAVEALIAPYRVRRV